MRAKPEAEDHDCMAKLLFNRIEGDGTENSSRTFKSEDGHTAHCAVDGRGYY
jgi:hypothetical protein